MKIISIIFVSSLALNKGLSLQSSKKMHPIDQMSTAIEYSVAPKRSSGALYQIVTTSCVYGRIGIENALAKPKSANLRDWS